MHILSRGAHVIAFFPFLLSFASSFAFFSSSTSSFADSSSRIKAAIMSVASCCAFARASRLFGPPFLSLLSVPALTSCNKYTFGLQGSWELHHEDDYPRISDYLITGTLLALLTWRKDCKIFSFLKRLRVQEELAGMAYCHVLQSELQ